MTILNIAGYKFIHLTDLEAWVAQFTAACQAVKGTILLSHEGINVSLAGAPDDIQSVQNWLGQQHEFADMTFRHSYSAEIPFKVLKVKIKPEIITIKQEDTAPLDRRSPSLKPTELKQWLDEARDFTLVDTRNDYEIQFGTFSKAVNLKVDQFSDLPEKLLQLDKHKPVVMYCTGGVRCEKAARYMENAGYDAVYQLEGGILNYFAEVGGDHYQGECFVFDERIALTPELTSIGTQQCTTCMGPIKANTTHSCR